MKKIVVPGLVAGLAMLVVSMIVGKLFNLAFPSLMAEYQNTALFRPWSDPVMNIYWAQPFILGLILAWIWDMTKSLVAGGNACVRGCRFGAIYWVVTVPGMVMSIASFPLSLVMVISWSASILAQALTAGYILALMNR